MSHFSKLDENNIVVEVIKAEQNFINSGAVGDSFLWVQTSYNNRFRGQYGAIGFFYDKQRDVFIPPAPFSTWVFNYDKHEWEPPIPKPDGDSYVWDQSTQKWIIDDLN